MKDNMYLLHLCRTDFAVCGSITASVKQRNNPPPHIKFGDKSPLCIKNKCIDFFREWKLI